MKLLICYKNGSRPFRINTPIDILLRHIALQVAFCPDAIKSIRIVAHEKLGGVYLESDNV